ncbi:ubiquinone biosynthesis protein Coq9p, mitochondrial [Trichomonascus vanleenenianus]|uniref:ubiquinone biosynthesis protein COQ9 n=1 Tax=Trichomonascus vanleenenianus TaxID=2268995 RepID=UPI003ECA4483
MNVFRRGYSQLSGGQKKVEILRRALEHVPKEGFERALLIGSRGAGYSDATHAVFPGGAFDLVKYHLETQRESLSKLELAGGTPYNKLEELMVKRLEGNRVIHPRLGEALAIMTQPGNLVSSLEELHGLSDEFWWLANDRTSDFSWYTKRAAVSSVYAASELFMVQDRSTGFRDTFDFARERLRDAEKTGFVASCIMEWAKFNTIASYNVFKSLTR